LEGELVIKKAFEVESELTDGGMVWITGPREGCVRVKAA